MKPANERGHSHEHVAALERYDLTVRLAKRHQTTYGCGAAQKTYAGKGANASLWNHAHHADVSAEHDQVIADREAAYLDVQAADPKLRQSSLADV